MAARGRGERRDDPEEGPEDGGRRERRRAGPRRPRGGGAGRLFRWALLLALWGVIIGGGIIGWFALTLPPTIDLTQAQRRPSVTLLGADGSLIATYGDLFGEPLKLNEMPRYLPEAVLATEDRRFYEHWGIDPIGTLRALYADIRAGHVVQGGSTITQQLAKNLFLTPDRTIKRKIHEALLAIWLEHKFTKDQLLEIYLNRIYLGAGTYGVDAAAHRYFDKSARHVTLYEAATIAGLLKAPTRFSPARDADEAAKRTAQVLTNMVNAGYITAAQAQAAEKQRSELALAGRVRPGNRYFADWVYELTSSYVQADGRDLVVTTTLDPRMQQEAEASIGHTLDKDGAKAKASQGALVAMAPDGAVRAMVGGRDYAASQFNRATQALRQPGSAFKPFVYLAALEHGMTPEDRFEDRPIRIGNWAPHNYENKYRGEVTASEALAESINTVAAQVIERAGIDNVIATAHRLGITSDLAHDASLALGTSEVTLLDLTSAYCAFASGGRAALPYGITEIRDRDGHVLYRRQGDGGAQVIDPAIDGELDQMMAGVIAHGTGRAAALPRPAAGKTGTTQDFRDAWFVGFTADLVTGVWFGNDDNDPMNHVTGGTLPARTWHSFMVEATQGMPIRPLPSAPETFATQVAAAKNTAAGWLSGLLHNIFGGDSAPRRPAAVEQRPIYQPPQKY
ncbi:MAG TPA: PBP1A family penicillin-binding protein [Stellaceae bacterium]|nr:PBP1A family penicillin-binding protein [Stellaceae bacterium]